jgi:hypothetical protein
MVRPGCAVWLRRYGFDGAQIVEAYGRVAGPTADTRSRLRIEGVVAGTGVTDVDLCGAGVVDAATGELLGMVVAEERFATAPVAWMIDLNTVATRYLPVAGAVPAAGSVNDNGLRPGRRRPAAMELARVMAELPTMRSQDGRNQLVETLPRQIANAIPRHTERRFDVLGIVRTCLEYPDGLDDLFDLLHAFEGDSEPMSRVDLLRAELFGSPLA